MSNSAAAWRTTLLLGIDATELVVWLQTGDVGCEELVRARLARLDNVAELGAVAWRDDERVLAEARRADERRASGEPLGVLHGLPVTVKDWIDVVGFPCAGGDAEQLERRPVVDATVVARVRAAGAVIMAKTCVTEVGYNGPVRNPWDPSRTAGQSSSGEAVAVATGVSALGFGSDSGGSLRFPAHCSGVSALRPTYGRVPLTGHFPLVGQMVDGRTVIGPLGRSVRDLRLGLSVIAGPDGRDPSMPPVAGVGSCSVNGLRVALHRDSGDAVCHPAIAGAMDVVAEALRLAGAVVDERDVLDVRRAADVTRRYWRRAGLAPVDVERLLGDWDLCRTEAMVLLDDVDAIVSPAAPHLAPVIGEGSMADWTYLLAPSLWGWPAISVPVGVADGLPYAAQVVAGPWREDIALAVAEVLERLVTLPVAPLP
jgi:amidase